MLLRLFLLIFVCLAGVFPPATKAAVRPEWTGEVEPILDRHCFKCHGGVKQKGGLDLRSLETMLRGGESGPAIVPHESSNSRLIQFIQPGAEPHMPPDEKKQLSPGEISVLRKWVDSLPRPRGLSSNHLLTNTAWIESYAGDLKASQKPVWTPPAKTTPAEAIDGFLTRSWRKNKIRPAPESDNSVFIRRVYLDLAGRIPSQEERDRFLADSQSGKQKRLVDNLLESDEYPRHMREIFDVVLMGRPSPANEPLRSEHGWNGYLEKSFRENRPWDQMVRDMIRARGTHDSNKGAYWFLYEKENNHQAMAEAVAPLAFGVNIKCAQCHNHPMAWEIEQRHYWGMVAAFNRSKPVQTPSGPAVSESAIGGFVNFANLKKESQPALLAFLNGKTVEEKWPVSDSKEEDKTELYRVPPPKDEKKEKAPAAVPIFSRRDILATIATEENPALAQAMVNRIWLQLMGRGLVHPVDQLDSRHPASHPELLRWLSADFERYGFDVKRLIRSIVLSSAYQLESAMPGEKKPAAESFAWALEKPLSAEQLFRSTLVALNMEEKECGEFRKALLNHFPGVMQVSYNPSLQQAMFFSNSPLVNDLLKPKGRNTAARLLALEGVENRIRSGFDMVLGREPDLEEMAGLRSFLAVKPGEKGVRDLLWTLLTSVEFQVNH